MSYLSNTEATNSFPQFSDYTQSQQTQFLAESYGLVNSFLAPTINTPAISSDGTVPQIVKILQARFLRWLCEFSNEGHKEELDELYASTVTMVQSLTNNELLINELQVTAHEIGWNLTASTVASGQIYVKGTPPALYTEYTGLVTSTGQNYQDSSTFTLTRLDSADVFATLEPTSREFFSVTNSNLIIRFEGLFTKDETFTIIGVPDTAKVVSAKNILKQADLIY